MTKNNEKTKILNSADDFLKKVEYSLPGTTFSSNREILRCLLSQLFVIMVNQKLHLDTIKDLLEYGKITGLMGRYIYKDPQHRAVKEEIKHLNEMGFDIRKVSESTYIYEAKDFSDSILYWHKAGDSAHVRLLPNAYEHDIAKHIIIKEAIKEKKVIVFDYIDEKYGKDELYKALETPSHEIKTKNIHLSPYIMENGILIGGRLEKNELAFPLYQYCLANMGNVRKLSYGKEKKVHFLSQENAGQDYIKVFKDEELSFYNVRHNILKNYKKYVITFLGDEFDDIKENFLLVETQKAKKLIDDINDERMETSFISHDELSVFKVIYNLNKNLEADIRFKFKQQQKRYEEWLEKQKKD